MNAFFVAIGSFLKNEKNNKKKETVRSLLEIIELICMSENVYESLIYITDIYIEREDNLYIYACKNKTN